MSDAFKIGCFNAGAGIKIFINKHLAIRTKYRYQRYDYKEEEKWNNYMIKDEYIITDHKVLFVISFFI